MRVNHNIAGSDWHYENLNNGLVENAEEIGLLNSVEFFFLQFALDR